MTREEAIKLLAAIAFNMAIKELEKETKTGRWIFVDKAHEHAHCSECGYGNVDSFDGRPHNYCPNCGAKMDGRKNC